MSKKIYSNIDNNVTDAEREEIERDERNSFLLDEKIKNSKGYKSHGFLNPRHATVTNDQVEWDAGDVRARRAAGKPVLPVFVLEQDNGDVQYVLTDADQEAVLQGYVCENCLGWQESNLSLGCETIKGFKCGYRRGM